MKVRKMPEKALKAGWAFQKKPKEKSGFICLAPKRECSTKF
jgi:hypothetical protein